MSTRFAFVFPGQGSQAIGMLDECAAEKVVRDTLAEANQALGFDLAALIAQGPVEQLNQTEHTQPALLACSIALWRLWCERGGEQPMLLAGHSLGEYSALVAAQVLDFSDAIRLVAQRGRFMQRAVPAGVGGMAAILGLDDEAVRALCLEAALPHEVLEAVNYNSVGQVVIAGHKTAVERACSLAKEKGAKRALALPVSVPSHCALMHPAAEQLAEQLDQLTLQTPVIPVVNNADVCVYTESSAIRAALVKQLYCPVRWVETIQYFAAQQVTHVIECGPGKVLTGLNKRIDNTLSYNSIFDRTSLEQVRFG